MKERFIPPTLNLEQVDERCAMIRHSTGLVEKSIKTAAIQNFAFGGVNTCFILSKFDE
jgi:3-oxoacyl-[acyl-carrier-protein] synthase II